jgi:hypothetical protein
VNKIKMGLGDMGWYGMNSIGLAQHRDKQRTLMNVVMNLQVP